MVDPRLPIESQSGPPACHAGGRSDPNPFGCEKVTDWITSAMHDLWTEIALRIARQSPSISGKVPPPDGGSSPGYCPFEERARDLGRQTSTASTGRRGLAWADSLG
jgi:hypothetical protein